MKNLALYKTHHCVSRGQARAPVRGEDFCDPDDCFIGHSHFELLFASFMEDCDDAISYAKNYLALNFKQKKYMEFKKLEEFLPKDIAHVCKQFSRDSLEKKDTDLDV